MPMGFFLWRGDTLVPNVLPKFKKPGKYTVKSSTVLSREISLL